jgi:hypothetical protein
MLEWRLDAYQRWQSMHGADLGARQLSQDRLPGSLLLLRAKEHRRDRRAWMKSIRNCCGPTKSSASRCRSRKFWRALRARKVAVDAVFDSVSVVTTFKDELKKAGVIFCSISEAVRDHPELVKKYLGSVVPKSRQLLRSAQLGGLLGRVVRLCARKACAARWSCRPISASTTRNRAVRADVDHRRKGLLRFAIWKAARRRCGMKTSCMPPSSN